MNLSINSAAYGNTGRISFGGQAGKNRGTTPVSGAVFGAAVQRVDKVSINGQSGMSKILDSFMQQKANVLEQRETLVSSTLQKGHSLDNIKEQLESYDEKLAEIEQQMVAAMAEESKKLLEANKEQNAEEVQQTEDPQQAYLNKITSLSGDFKQAQTVASVQKRTENGAKILESEIKQDKMQGASAKDVAKKQDKLLSLRHKASNLNSDFHKRLADISNKTSTAPEQTQAAENAGQQPEDATANTTQVEERQAV